MAARFPDVCVEERSVVVKISEKFSSNDLRPLLLICKALYPTLDWTDVNDVTGVFNQLAGNRNKLAAARLVRLLQAVGADAEELSGIVPNEATREVDTERPREFSFYKFLLEVCTSIRNNKGEREFIRMYSSILKLHPKKLESIYDFFEEAIRQNKVGTTKEQLHTLKQWLTECGFNQLAEKGKGLTTVVADGPTFDLQIEANAHTSQDDTQVETDGPLHTHSHHTNSNNLRSNGNTYTSERKSNSGCTTIKWCLVCITVLLAISLLVIFAVYILAYRTSTTANRETKLIYEEEVVLVTRLGPTVQSADISEIVSASTNVHVVSLYSVNCDLLNYTSEVIADVLNENYRGGGIVPFQTFSYYAGGSLVNLSISVLCYPMPCSRQLSVSFVFFMDYNQHLSFCEYGSPLESLDNYTVKEIQLLSHPSVVSVPINSTGFYFIDLVLPKKDSLTYAVFLNITGTRFYLNVTNYEKYYFCTLSPSNPSCHHERSRPLDDSTYCILAYVTGQPPSVTAIRFANVTSVLQVVVDHSIAIYISYGVGILFLIFLCSLFLVCLT